MSASLRGGAGGYDPSCVGFLTPHHLSWWEKCQAGSLTGAVAS